MRRPNPPRQLEHVAVADQVRLDIGRWIDERIANARLGAEMHDLGDPMAPLQVVERFGVGKVHDLEPKVLPEVARDPLDPGAFERRVVIIVEIIDADDFVTAG